MSDGTILGAPMASVPGPVLVIGSSGFIGANLLRMFLEVRRDAFGTVSNGVAWRLEGVPVRHLPHLDLLDPDGVREVLDRIAPRSIFHCAAYGAYSFQDEAALIYRTNFLALSALLEELANRPVAAFVHAGSSSEYGLNCTAPDEDARRSPNSPYAVAKSAASDLIAYYGKVRGVPCINLRLYSVYGPYEDSSRLIPTLIRCGLNGSLPPLVAPETTRDFVHVEDAVSAFCAAATSMSPTLYGESYNIATGRKLSIREVAEIARRTFHIDDLPSFGAMSNRAWDLAGWYGNPAKAGRELGWSATIDFESGLARTAHWWRQCLAGHAFEQLTEKGRKRRGRNSLTAIVACYQDAQAIPVMHRRLTDTLSALHVDYEIIFVNDGSPDDSPEIIRRISGFDPRVSGITHSRNFGSQAAFRSGMELSTREACVLLDGDLQDPPELIAQFIEKWRAGYDVVYGRRVKREMGLLLGSMYKAFYRVFAALSNIPVPRDAGDFSLIDSAVVRWMLACQERDSFLRGLRAYVGFRQTGIDYVRPQRPFGRSTNSLLRNLGWAKKAIFSFSTAPLDLFTVIGIGLFGITALLAVIVLTLKLVAPHLAPPGITALLLSVMFFGSINVLGLAVLGEYIGKIVQEVKHRPAFIRRHLISAGQIQELRHPLPAENRLRAGD